MGGGEREWTTATLFVISDTGIIFGAPDMVRPEHIKATGDGKELTDKGLKALAENPGNVFQVEIARKPPTEMARSSHRASMPLAREILRETKAQILSSALLSAFSGQHRR